MEKKQKTDPVKIREFLDGLDDSALTCEAKVQQPPENLPVEPIKKVTE